ncbi:MAG: hypothetical protein ABSC48_13285 [Terracidiphilus sp.]|jgi:uncharacterized membrane protein
MSEPTPSPFTDNAAGAIAYITPVPAIVFLVLEPYNKSSYVRFHSWQSIFLFIVWVVVSVVMTMLVAVTAFLMPFLMWRLAQLINLAFFIVWIICLVQAVNGKRFKLPVIGALAEKQAGA